MGKGNGEREEEDGREGGGGVGRGGIGVEGRSLGG